MGANYANSMFLYVVISKQLCLGKFRNFKEDYH